MALSLPHRTGHPARSIRESVEQGTYTVLLTAAGFIIVNLLRLAERRDDAIEDRGSSRH